MGGHSFPPPRYQSALAPNGLRIHTSTLRVVSWYDAKLPVSDRVWFERVGSGLSYMPSHISPRCDSAVCSILRTWCIDVTGDGWLEGPTSASAPDVVLFWRYCEDILRDAGRTPNASESAFLYSRVVRLAVSLDITHLVATDGSRDTNEDNDIVLARAAVVFSDAGATRLVAKLERWSNGLERHSYDAECAAYLDVASKLPDGARALYITDCLSGGGRSCEHTQEKRAKAG